MGKISTISEMENHFEFNICAGMAAGAARFNISIPSMSLSPDQSTSRCLFTLKNLTIGPVSIAAAGLAILKLTAFNLDISGLGFKPNSFTMDINGGKLINNAGFLIPNIMSQSHETNAGVVDSGQNITGNYLLDEKRICSNPFGCNLEVNITDEDRDNLALEADTFITLKFCIDLLPPEEASNSPP